MPRLGQHFLKNSSIAEKIVRSGGVCKNDMILEIGPGKGILTRVLLSSGAHVIAVEKDASLSEFLQHAFSKEIQNEQLMLINKDILELDPVKLGLVAGNYKLVANIPYYITGKIIRKFLGTTCQPSLIILLVQKQVAERILARDKKESILSQSVKAFGTPRYIDTVKRGSFIPPPKVDSAIIAIEKISKDFFGNVDEKFYFHLVRKGFSHKRKKLVGNLSGERKKQVLEEAFSRCGISLNARAEELTSDMWKCLGKNLIDSI